MAAGLARACLGSGFVVCKGAMLSLHMIYAFFCPSCDAREVSAGDCPCGDGPFLDLRTQMARDLLEDIDNKRKRRRDALHRWLTILPTVATVVGLWVLLPSLFEDGEVFFAVLLELAWASCSSLERCTPIALG